LSSLGDEEKIVMQDVMNEWKDHVRGAPGGSSSTGTILPPGPGEWDEDLGVPLCVVCQGVRFMYNLGIENISNSIGRLTKLSNWKRRMVGERRTLTTFYSS
jgi:hypothetical protein